MLKRKYWLGAAAAALVGAGVVIATTGFAKYEGAINARGVDLSAPQAYVITSGLSRLPRDLVKAPVLKDVLTQDLVFYYEDHEDKLGLRGALKRIAYEHDTTLTDKLVATALDEPAEVALWADDKGAPRYWLIAMTRGTLARAIQGAAAIAADDQQLSILGTVRANNADVTVFALTLSPRRTLVVASQGARVVVLSDPGLLFLKAGEADPESLKVVAALLSDDRKTEAVYQQRFGVGDPGKGHTLVADAQLMSLGYQQFLPGYRALRVDVAADGASVRTQLRVADAKTLPAERAPMWSALPVDPAACTLLPAQWTQIDTVLTDAPGFAPTDAQAKALKRFEANLDGPAAVCWYARSQLHTPVFIAHTKDTGADSTVALDTLAQWFARKPAVADAAAKPADAAAKKGAAGKTGSSAQPGGSTATALTVLGITDGAKPDTLHRRWQQEVAAPWGQHVLGKKASYKPTLAREGQWIVYSPDDELVGLTLDALAKRYPSLEDTLPANGSTLAVLAPQQIADLAQKEAFRVLPPEQEVLYQAARSRLLPRLAALRKLPTARAVANGAPDANGWVAVDWQPLAAPAAAPAAVPAKTASAQ